MLGKLEELAEIETHKYTYPVSRTEFGKKINETSVQESFDLTQISETRMILQNQETKLLSKFSVKYISVNNPQ